MIKNSRELKRTYSAQYIQKINQSSPALQVWLRLWRRKDARVSFIIVCIYFIIALLVTVNILDIQAKARDYDLSKLRELRFHPMWQSFRELFGTDNFGRNVVLRAIVGTQISIFLGLLYSILMIPFAVFTGAIGGYYGRWFDGLLIYMMSVIVAIPGILVILSLTKILGASYTTIAFAFAITGWVGLARVVRATVMQSKEFEYVLAARNLGASDFRIIFIHILPNITHFVIINFVLGFVRIIKSEIFLAYIGFTVVGVPSWGIMITDGNADVISKHWQNLLGATLFMSIFLLALNILGDAVRDVLDPKLKNRS